MKRPSVPSLHEADQRLWEAVVATVAPLRGRRRSIPSAAHPQRQPGPQENAPTTTPRRKASGPVSAVAHAHQPPPLPVLDRRTRQRLMRGQVEIEARLDLHGETAITAPQALSAFLGRARERGWRTVLVVTGKGGNDYVRHTLHSSDHWHAPERQGVLRRSFPEWIASPSLRDVVAGYQPAHPRHGGGGAWYVRLRRSRDQSGSRPD